ncbi:hypothetical protein GE09DRAFT_1223797 [Coniochaeta sp. 2T2.1]|nr:hypothetical protein GE09DRAFT_1223797 [Coniochaeta sp. 2T2.1]
MTRSYSSRPGGRVPSDRQRNRQLPAPDRNGTNRPQNEGSSNDSPAPGRTASPAPEERNTSTPSRSRRSTSISRTALFADIEGYDSDDYSYHGGRTRISRRPSAMRRSEVALYDRWRSTSRARNSTYGGYDSESSSSDGEIDFGDGPRPSTPASAPRSRPADLAELRRIYAADAEREAAAARAATVQQSQRCNELPSWYANTAAHTASNRPLGRTRPLACWERAAAAEESGVAAAHAEASNELDGQQQGRLPPGREQADEGQALSHRIAAASYPGHNPDDSSDGEIDFGEDEPPQSLKLGGVPYTTVNREQGRDLTAPQEHYPRKDVEYPPDTKFYLEGDEIEFPGHKIELPGGYFKIRFPEYASEQAEDASPVSGKRRHGDMDRDGQSDTQAGTVASRSQWGDRDASPSKEQQRTAKRRYR